LRPSRCLCLLSTTAAGGTDRLTAMATVPLAARCRDHVAAGRRLVLE
jgi:hypothetical protein